MSRRSGVEYSEEYHSRYKCQEDGHRWFNPIEALETMAGFAYDPFVLEKVIRPLAKQYGPLLQFEVCSECILRLVQIEREATEMKPDNKGHFILSPDDERYGRMEERTGSIMARGSRNTATAEENATPAAPAAEAAPQVDKGAELLKEFPEGTLVEVTGKGNEFVNGQGRVLGVEEVRGTHYLQISVEVYANGKRREGDKVKVTRTRKTSVTKIDKYRDEPAAPAPAAPAAEDASATA